MSIPLLMMDEKIRQVRVFMMESSIDAWLIYDFRGFDPTGIALLGDLTPHSRQYAILITLEDPIIIIKPRIESHELMDISPKILTFNARTQLEFKQTIIDQTKQFHRLAANFSNNPQTDVLPSGRFELLKSALPEAEWVSGENLMQIIHSVLSKAQLKSQARAAKTCARIMEEAFSFLAERVGEVTEEEVADFILYRFKEENLTTAETPMVAVQENTANPHYTAGKLVIRKNHLVMIDLWAKWEIFADMTWMAYTGSKIPPEIQTIWDIILEARKNATKAIRPNISAQIPDKRAREVIVNAGYGDAILHRTGHSIDTTVHGKGANLDSFEMPETRLLLPNTIVSVEPGIYLPGNFGVRSEIDVVVTTAGHHVTTPKQENILLI